MVNLNNVSKRQLKTALNLNHEIGGLLTGPNTSMTLSTNVRRGLAIKEGNRGEVQIPEGQRRYHTHPSCSYAIPSAEDIVSAIKSQKRQYSVVATTWGIYIIINKNYNKNNETTRKYYGSNFRLRNSIISDMLSSNSKLKEMIAYVISRMQKGCVTKSGPLNSERLKKALYNLNKHYDKFFEIKFVPWS
jgi:hypothetical protein